MKNKSRILGISDSGSPIHIKSIVEKISLLLSPDEIMQATKIFLDCNKNWKDAAYQSPIMYYKEFARLPYKSNNNLVRTKFGLSDLEAELAYRGTMLAITGISHYLEWAGFNFQNPVSFDEISTKIGFTRAPCLRIMIQILKNNKEKSIKQEDIFSDKKLPTSLGNFYTECFGIGSMLGFIIAQTHAETEVAEYTLEQVLIKNFAVLNKKKFKTTIVR